MKVGDLVKFIDEGTYAKWFLYQLGRVESVSGGTDGTRAKVYCRVRWLFPVKYFNRYTQISDFSADKFEVCK